MNKWERNDGYGFGVMLFWILDLGNFLCAGVLYRFTELRSQKLEVRSYML
ncbi:MAG: hypothetical protein F6K17_25115 [Okeania sp. SIO3C4]|nr:hypothetical protein [Okeania sp. SIO3C4]